MGLHYSPPLLPSCISLPLGLWAILPKHGCNFSQTTTCKSRNTKYFDLWYIVVTYSWGGPACTYCPNMSWKFHYLTLKQPSNSLPFFHYELVTENSELKLNMAKNYRIWEKITCNFESVFCDQFLMEEWQTIRRLFGVRLWNFELKFGQ